MPLFRPTETRAVVSGQGTYNPYENPAVPLQSVGFDNVWSTQNNDAGQAVTAETAASVATFYRCLYLVSSVIAGCPFNVFRKSDRTPIDHHLFDVSNKALTYTPFELMQLIVVYRLVWGDVHVFKKRDDQDGIIDLKPIFPELVKTELDDDGNKIFLVKKLRPDGTIDESAKPQVFTEFEILHIPSISYDGLSGLIPYQLMAQTLGTTIAADKLAAKFYRSGQLLGGIIKVKAPLASQTQAEGIKARWMNAHAGVAAAGDVAVLDAETDFQDVTIPPDQLQFLQSRRWQTTEIARWFGVPPHLVGDVEKSTSWGTGIEVQNVGLTTYTLRGHTDPIEQRFTRELVLTRGHYGCFDLDALMRGSTAERYAALAQAVGGPWLSVNEARVSENREPKDDPKYDDILPPQGIGPTEEAPQGQPSKKPEQGQSEE